MKSRLYTAYMVPARICTYGAWMACAGAARLEGVGVGMETGRKWNEKRVNVAEIAGAAEEGRRWEVRMCV